MRTTSAPTYFPMYSGYADGALVAQNPSLAAVGRAYGNFHILASLCLFCRMLMCDDICVCVIRYAHFPAVTPENTMVLSIGCGNSLKELKAADVSHVLSNCAPKGQMH